MYELADDNHALGDAHLTYAQRLLDQGDTFDAGAHLRSAREVFGPAAEPVERGRLLVEEARHALQDGQGDEAVSMPSRRSRCSSRSRPTPESATPTWCWPACRTRSASWNAPTRPTRPRWSRSSANPTGAGPGRAYRHYGKFLKRLGRAEAALEAFELAADLAPSNQDALAPLPTADARSPSDR